MRARSPATIAATQSASVPAGTSRRSPRGRVIVSPSVVGARAGGASTVTGTNARDRGRRRGRTGANPVKERARMNVMLAGPLNRIKRR